MKLHKRRLGAIRPAKVLSVYIDKSPGGLNLPVCNIADSHGGVYLGVRWLISGVNDAKNITYTPPSGMSSAAGELPVDKQPEVLISFQDSSRPMPVIMGSIFTGAEGIAKRISRKRATAATAPKHTSSAGPQDRDIDEKNHARDHFVEHHGIRFSYVHTGRYEVDLKKTKEIAGFAFHKDAWLRLSHQLTSDYTSPGGAAEYVILGEKFLAHYEELVKAHNDLVTKVVEIVTKLNSGLVVPSTAVEPTTDTTVATQTASAGLVSPSSFTSVTATADERKKYFTGVLRVSPRTVDEQP